MCSEKQGLLLPYFLLVTKKKVLSVSFKFKKKTWKYIYGVFFLIWGSKILLRENPKKQEHSLDLNTGNCAHSTSTWLCITDTKKQKVNTKQHLLGAPTLYTAESAKATQLIWSAWDTFRGPHLRGCILICREGGRAEELVLSMTSLSLALLLAPPIL